MKIVHRSVSLLLLLSIIFAGPTLNAQKRTRAELLKEAARLVTEAERAAGEAWKKVQAGGDRQLVRDAEKATAESFEKAIELWREAGDDKRLIAAADEMTRLYSVHGEYEKVVDRLTREAEYWRKRGKIVEQTDTLYTLAIRQSQMGRDAAAIETYLRVIELCRTAGLQSLEPNVHSQLSISYTRVGRVKDAEASKATADKLWSMPRSEPRPAPPFVEKPIPPATIPSQWVDLPGAPAAAEYRVIQGVNEAVLVNRSTKGIEMAMFGCVALEDNGKVRVLHGLLGQGRNHGGVGPGQYYEPFVVLNGPLNRWTDEKMGCEGAAKMTLIEVTFDDRTKWKADGIHWTGK